MNHYTETYNSPIGLIVIESDGQALTGLRFCDEEPSVAKTTYSEAELIRINAETTTSMPPIFAEVIRWLDDYFAGRRPCNVSRLNTKGTAFQKRVWAALFTIWYGQTKTYGEIAEMVGCKSAQAVGQAIGRNPIALIIPCHRVVGVNGKLGGYAYGNELKRKLLELEK